MGFSYRKRKGPLSFSVSKRGPRVSVGMGGRKSAMGCLLPTVLAFMLLLVGVSAAVLATQTAAGAHQSGCHGAHSCPSDKRPPSYRCGDSGNPCRFSNDPAGGSDAAPQLSGPPSEANCRDNAAFYATNLCTAAAAATPQPAAAATPRPAAQANTNDNLPKSGVNTLLLGMSGIATLEAGWALLLLSGSMKRRARPKPPWLVSRRS